MQEWDRLVLLLLAGVAAGYAGYGGWRSWRKGEKQATVGAFLLAAVTLAAPLVLIFRS